MPVMETIFLATMAFAAVRSLMPNKSPKVIVPTTPTLAAPNTTISHVTNTDGEGSNAVFNVSFVNNNGNAPQPSPPTPPPSPTALESAQQYIRKTFGSIHFSDIASTTYEYCCQNKYYIAAGTVISSYGYMFYKIRSIQSYIDNHGNWNAWKRDIPFETLLAIPQDQLTRDLMMAVQARYISAENPTDSLTPLITFSNDIAQEKELLIQYHSYISWSMQFSLQRVIPFSQTLLTQLTERKQRITYLSTLFHSWLAHYKLEQITR